MSHLVFFVWVFSSVSVSLSFCPNVFVHHTDHQFVQKTDRFWEFQEETNSWVEVELPYDLVSCVNGNCTKVGLINRGKNIKEQEKLDETDGDTYVTESLTKEKYDVLLPQRKRISLTKMSATSIWITGESGSIYERFWNGVQWVIAPHDLSVSAGPAISVFIVNQTILALSEAGNLYQMQLSENSQQSWEDLMPSLNQSMHKGTEQNSATQIKSGVVSRDARKAYFCTKKGMLLEFSELDPPRWINHGRPPGADVAAIADVANIKEEVIFTISSTGILYEYEKTSKPPWKKHIWRDETENDTSLVPLLGCILHRITGDNSISLFLLTKGGRLAERRLHQRKWKWIIHGHPRNHHLTSITPVLKDELNEKLSPLFLTASAGSVFEYQIQKHPATKNHISEASWVNHKHPLNAKAARGIAGLPFQVGRILFPLDDGRLAELHMLGLGGENSGPTDPVNIRRKTSNKYVWSILDAPESEGWNSEYCTEERGPANCMTGTKDELGDSGIARTVSRRRKSSQTHETYLTQDALEAKASEEYSLLDKKINSQYRLRVMSEGRSFFLVTDSGLTFEHLYAENLWFWLQHDHPSAMKGALGNYYGSLFLVDVHGNLYIRERSGDELLWINCTALRKGRQVISGPPWDVRPGKAMQATLEDAIFFVSKSGRLLQFTVALRKFKWKDCKHPPNAKVESITDQEQFRKNIVFVIGKDGHLYQYNKVTEVWHEHYQSQHLILSRQPGTAMRPSQQSLTGSLFMISEDGGLVEYHWNAWEGWNWVEHGTPSKSVTLVSSPGPWFEGHQLFLIGSDGNIYLRHMDETTWRWKKCHFPYISDLNDENQKQPRPNERRDICVDNSFAASQENDEENLSNPNENCDSKVASTRPIPFSETSMIFELRDGRLAEMQKMEGTRWIWSRIIGTPTSSCNDNYWIAFATQN